MEETLYNIFGAPIAYIAYDNDATIYMWNGRPVAYLVNDMIYGFNGKHLGWFINGIVWNKSGEINGFNQMASDVCVALSPFKGFKEYLPYKAYREYPSYRPFFSRCKASESLSQFLMKGWV